MGQDNTVPRRINRVEGSLGQMMLSGGPGVVEAWGRDLYWPLLTDDNTWVGIYTYDTAGQNLAFGDAVYMKAADGKLWKADADQVTTMPCVALATAAITADNDGYFLLIGFIRDNAWSWTAQDELYVNTGGGGNPTATMPTGSGDQVQIIGQAWTANIIWFLPDWTICEVA